MTKVTLSPRDNAGGVIQSPQATAVGDPLCKGVAPGTASTSRRRGAWRAALNAVLLIAATTALSVLLRAVLGRDLSWLPAVGGIVARSRKKPASAKPVTNADAEEPQGRDPELLGDRRGGEQKVTTPLRKPGKARKRQTREYELRKSAELIRIGEARTDAEALAKVRAELAAREKPDADTEAAIAAVKPALHVVPSTEVDRGIELAAIFRLPVMIWLRLWLGGCLNGPKTKVGRTFAVAVGLEMGLGFGTKKASLVRDQFRKANPVGVWTHLYPTDPGPDDRSRFYRQIATMFGRGRNHKVWMYINRELVMELAGELVVREHKNGNRTTYFSRVRDAFRYLLVDAVLLEAQLAQHKPINEQHRQLMRGSLRARCGFLVYSRMTAQARHLISRAVHGYKWIEIVDLKLQVPLIGMLIPANANERQASLKLMDELLQLYPELKQVKEYFVVGDALYDMHEQYAYELMIKYGAFGVFPRAGKVSAGYAWADNGGVPQCECGDAVFDQASDWPTPEYRIKNGLPDAGQWCIDASGKPIDGARIRWKCPEGRHNIPDTYFRQNARLYTYLPHAGDHKRRKLRAALLAYRNVIESGFAWAEDLGFAGDGLMRPRWAKDDQMDHFAWMVAVSRTARKVIHRVDEQGSSPYDRALKEAERVRMMEMSTAEEPASGIVGRTKAEVAAMRQRWLDTMRPPDRWSDTDLRIPRGWPGAGTRWTPGKQSHPDDDPGNSYYRQIAA